jgi:hypothetical protein
MGQTSHRESAVPFAEILSPLTRHQTIKLSTKIKECLAGQGLEGNSDWELEVVKLGSYWVKDGGSNQYNTNVKVESPH